MRRLFLFTLGFFALVNYCTAQNYEIDFYIHDNDDDTIFLTSYRGGKTEISHPMPMQKDGSYHLSLKDYPEGMYMLKDQEKRDMFSFILGKSSKFSIEIYKTGEVFVKGCQENDAYMLYQYENRIVQEAMYYYKVNSQAHPEQHDSLYQEVDKAMKKFDAFQESFFKTYPNNFISVVYQNMNQVVPTSLIEGNKVKPGKEREYVYYMRQHYWDYFDFKDMRAFYSPYFIKQFNNYISEVTPQIADSVCLALDEFIQTADRKGGKEYADYIIGWYLSNMPRMPFSYNEIVYIHVVDKYLDRASLYIPPSEIEAHRQYANKIARFLPGKTMPNLIATDLEGMPQSLYSLKNKFVVVYFFSSTCESCKKNLDALKDLYRMNKDYYDLEIFSIDLEEDLAIVKARQNMDPFPWIVTHASAEDFRPMGFVLDHTPEMYILDSNKRIINKTPAYEQVEKVLDAVINSTLNQ